MSGAGIDIAHLKGWEGRSEEVRERIAPFPATALAATLDRDEAYAEGTPLPPLWHWLHFLPVFKLSEANYDGHAALGGFLPPVPLPRRMWAGSRLRFHAPMRIGRELVKRSRVVSVAHKAGRSGDLVFVTVAHEVWDGDTLGIAEEHDIVYRAPPAPGDPAPAPLPCPEAGFGRRVTPSPVLLFRYSALTFNGHRIHYDQPFCTGTEGYGGLVVHGPLLATLMLDLLRRERPEATVTAFEFRAKAPVFDTAPFDVQGAWDGSGAARLWVRGAEGGLAMEGRATFTTGDAT